jgi:ribosome-associated translation inhibitor RaiA
MQIDIRRHGTEIDEATRDHLERRLDFALGRLDHRVARVQVQLSDEHSQRGGRALRCRILVHLRHLPDVLVEDSGPEWIALIDQTVNRAGQVARRELDRRHSRR